MAKKIVEDAVMSAQSASDDFLTTRSTFELIPRRANPSFQKWFEEATGKFAELTSSA